MVTCPDCGAEVVHTAGRASGKPYAANFQEYPNGKRYLRGPHFKTCDKGTRRSEQAREELAIAERVLADHDALVVRVVEHLVDPDLLANLATRRKTLVFDLDCAKVLAQRLGVATLADVAPSR